MRQFGYLWATLFLLIQAQAQEPTGSGNPDGAPNKIWLSGQVNVVTQFHPPFHALETGPSSLQPDFQIAPTWVATIYTGYALSPTTEFFFDIESARGAGVSGALGLGGLGDLDAVTDRRATAAPYVARAMVRKIIALGDKMSPGTTNPLGLAPNVPERRLELRLGKMSITDFFDLNSVGSDSHLQFLNYSIDNNAAYDIAANSRGYTYAALAELYQPAWSARFAEAVEPKETSGLHPDWNLARSRSENLELELHPSIHNKQPFILRGLAFLNHSQMASYPAAVSAFLSGQDPRPDLSAHIGRGTNHGFGLNGESAIGDALRVFSRFGWNPGNREAFQFAEADRTLVFGGDLSGKSWHKPTHRIGLAFAVNSLATAHRSYLELGGVSYLLGDGGLVYGREKVIETYYNVPLGHGIFAALDVQQIWNPGYNQSRGPVTIFGLRLHAEGDIHFN